MSFETAWVIGQNTRTTAFDIEVNGSPVAVRVVRVLSL